MSLERNKLKYQKQVAENQLQACRALYKIAFNAGDSDRADRIQLTIDDTLERIERLTLAIGKIEDRRIL